MPLSFAVLGTGRIGGSYLDVVKNARQRLAAVAEPREEQVAPLKKKHPDADYVADYKEAIRRNDVDAVIITLPHFMHHRATIDALEAGKHVFVEKPMALTVRECDEMIAAAKKNRRLLMVAHTQRYFPSVKKMKEIVDSKELGDVVMVHDIWHKVLAPESRPKWMLDQTKGGGMGQMDGSHMIDRLLWILGPDVYSVSGRVGNFTHPHIPADDTAMCFMRWKHGPVATISRIAFDHGKGYTEYGGEYFFTKGQAKFRIAYGSGPTQKSGVWVAKKDEWVEAPIKPTDSLLDEVNDFVRAIESSAKEPPIPMEHGRKVIEVLEATEESSRTGREVIVGI
ncbi:MAG: Gfo/Idh/MocA family oxidoreductase [Chloroflexi bacterium]|nr:Gfo/Idh/MocA family oxidoreductase [Chloroflexota bacterium]